MSVYSHSLIHRPYLAGFVKAKDHRVVSPSAIIIHRNTVSALWKEEHPEDADIDDASATARFHRQKLSFRLFPYHFFIDDDGPGSRHATVNQIHTCDTIAPHAAPNNTKSVGIALNVDGRKEPPGEAMERAAIWLVACLLAHYPRAEVVGHDEHKRCPGPFVKVDWIAERAREIAKEISHGDSGIAFNREEW